MLKAVKHAGGKSYRGRWDLIFLNGNDCLKATELAVLALEIHHCHRDHEYIPYNISFIFQRLFVFGYFLFLRTPRNPRAGISALSR